MAKIVWSELARADQRDIYVTIAEDSPDAAERVYEQLEERIALLANNPRLGVPRPEIGASVRMLVRGVYLIFYEVDPDLDRDDIREVLIVRIVHGHRDLSRIL